MEIDYLKGIGELGMGSRLKRISEHMMRHTQIVYDTYQIDFDPYLFPIFKIIQLKNGITNTEIKNQLQTSQPAITQSLKKLLDKGLITMVTDTLDKRKKKIFLSDKGILLIEKISPIWKSIETSIKAYTNFTSHSLLEHLNILEDKLNTNSFSSFILQQLQMNTQIDTMEIINFSKQYSKDFYNLNIEWLEAFFYVEPYDREVLSKPQKYIIDKNGYIFLAKYNEEIIGTVALMPNNGTYELTKMAVAPGHRGKKIGQKLMQHCIAFAKAKQMPNLILYSNTILENAIYIYRKYNFVEIPVEENCPYERCNIKMMLKL